MGVLSKFDTNFAVSADWRNEHLEPCSGPKERGGRRVSRQQSRPVERTCQSLGGTTRDTANVWPLRSSLELGALPTAVPCARLHARQLVWEWGLDGLAETAELLVSELVTNAVQATAREEGRRAVRLQLFGDNARVRIEVWDTDPRPPAPKDLAEDGIPDLEAEGGRGLFLVAALSACWDWYLTLEPTGKVVWCEVEAERPKLSEVGGLASQPLLPRRIPRRVQVRPVVVMNDPDILRRLRNALRETREHGHDG